MKLYVNLKKKELNEILKTSKELSGFARARPLDDGSGFYIYDFYILSSFNKHSFTSMSVDDVSKFFANLIKKGVDTNDITVWWHTHPMGTASFSTYDDQTIENILDDSDYFISIVFNHFMEFAGRINIFKPIRLSVDVGVELVKGPVTTGSNKKTLDLINRRMSRSYRGISSTLDGWPYLGDVGEQYLLTEEGTYPLTRGADMYEDVFPKKKKEE